MILFFLRATAELKLLQIGRPVCVVPKVNSILAKANKLLSAYYLLTSVFFFSIAVKYIEFQKSMRAFKLDQQTH